ncbi:phenylalanine--tRNA ligase subunit beta [Rubellicoccus peritrichatus]|uniref:Phenylalanine--tRNA ligase beta subunit n=1 Tax=Rubellicoccus peritrichatus TaxID=3080537 RepID=A0AAQ3QU61_9BACT|nr:phenylalanine--tRNA ligase subunit beta [Puniceicoccus sp. CR14]WOO42076.1 phenylalanine--tRNA ligase subunit beta [Puniceicoccus sp. CR14]
MKISLNWLKDYISLTATAEEVAEALPMLGLEVEATEQFGMPPMENLVVGEVLSREQHPNADRLGVCQVKTSADEEPRQIVCGATNYKVGDRIPVALPGCRLPGDFKIKKSKLRGVESHGMMCSAKELGLGNDHEGLLILSDRPEIGTPMNEVFPDNDTVFEIELTANRGDCLGQIGVARDLAAYFDLEVALPQVAAHVAEGEGLISGVDVSTDNCPYYTVWSIRGVKITESPGWLKRRLEAVGLRPINNVVDVTNYVLMETGQPLHAFDSKKIAGGKLIVRQATAAEKITTLDEKEHKLDERDMVIADTEKPLVIAGVMGSLAAEVDDTTTDVVLESAWFKPGSVRGTSRRHNIHTDSSYRFARDVDPAGVDLWGRRAIDLILQLAGGEVSGPCLVHGEAPRGDRVIEIDAAYVRRVCGYDATEEQIVEVFTSLGFVVRDRKSGGWAVTVPSFRPEVDRPIDLVEEFVRIHGTRNIPARPVKATGLHRHDAPLAVFNHKAQDLLSAKQFQECCHYSLCDADQLKTSGSSDAEEKSLSLANPLTSEMSHIRSSLIPGLLNALRLNRSRGNVVRRLFETGQVFRGGEGELTELGSVAFLIAVDEPERTWLEREKPDFFTAKSLVDEVATLTGVSELGWKSLVDSTYWQDGHAAEAQSDGVQVKAGLLSIEMLKAQNIEGLVLAGEIIFNNESLKDTTSSTAHFQPFSDYPASERDLALVVDQAEPAVDVVTRFEAAAQAAAGDAFTAEKVAVFDVYSGKGLPEGKKSLGLSIAFRAADRTLKEKEVNTAFDKIQTEMKDAGYAIRE